MHTDRTWLSMYYSASHGEIIGRNFHGEFVRKLNFVVDLYSSTALRYIDDDTIHMPTLIVCDDSMLENRTTAELAPLRKAATTEHF